MNYFKSRFFFPFQPKMSQKQLAYYQLDNEWTVFFQVKQRESLQYNKDDFLQSFLSVGKKSKKLQDVLDAYYTIPSIQERYRGIVAIFKDNIQPIYEDKENENMTIIKFSITTDKEAFDKLSRKLSNDKKGQSDKKYLGKIAPYFENKKQLDDFLNFLVVTVLLGKLEKIKDSLNGIYLKQEEGWIGVEFWYNKKTDIETPNNQETPEEQLIKNLLEQIKVVPVTYKDNDQLKEMKTLADTLKISRARDYPKKSENKERRSREESVQSTSQSRSRVDQIQGRQFTYQQK